MTQKKASYSLEFKLQAIHLVKESGQSMAEIARSPAPVRVTVSPDIASASEPRSGGGPSVGPCLVRRLMEVTTGVIGEGGR